LPATFFIATGFRWRGRMWNDTIIEAFRRCPPPRRPSPARDRRTGSARSGGEELERLAIDTVINAPNISTATPVSPQPADRRDGGRDAVGSPMMTSAQVRALHAAGMQIGAHTVSHPILARLQDDDALEEMASSNGDSKRSLRHRFRSSPIRMGAQDGT
jgi:peptidoglycan/xylan/chitin deacetylase (PgdA/CDA1 family)